MNLSLYKLGQEEEALTLEYIVIHLIDLLAIGLTAKKNAFLGTFQPRACHEHNQILSKMQKDGLSLHLSVYETC